MAPYSQAVMPTFADIEQAAQRIAGHAHVTPVLRSRSLDQLTGAKLFFKNEAFQRVGAFKFRGACNAVWSLPDSVAARGVVTHSSGNHGAALALAARTRGISAHVIVPEGAVRSKVAGDRGLWRDRASLCRKHRRTRASRRKRARANRCNPRASVCGSRGHRWPGHRRHGVVGRNRHARRADRAGRRRRTGQRDRHHGGRARAADCRVGSRAGRRRRYRRVAASKASASTVSSRIRSATVCEPWSAKSILRSCAAMA